MPFVFAIYISSFHPPNSSEIGRNIHLLKRLINTYNVLMSMLMRNGRTEKKVLDDVVKLFLSCYDDVEREFKVRQSGMWEKQNFISLLNLPEQTFDSGNLRVRTTSFLTFTLRL